MVEWEQAAAGSERGAAESWNSRKEKANIGQGVARASSRRSARTDTLRQ